MKKTLLILMSIMFLSCGYNETFKIAGDNRSELLKVLYHYKFVDRTPQKYEAAAFLIKHMHYHASFGRLIDGEETLPRRVLEADSIYYALVKDHSNSFTELNQTKLNRQIFKVSNQRKSQLEKQPEDQISVDNHNIYFDCTVIDSDLLISHIDNAFGVWKHSPYAKGLSFDEFKEYILPYRALEYEGFHVSGAIYNQLLSKYFPQDTTLSITDFIKYYNKTISRLRNLNGDSKLQYKTGLYDFFSMRSNDCVDYSNYGCNILRSLGLPMMVEYNIVYTYQNGSHFYGSVYDVENKSWSKFTPGNTVPGDLQWNWEDALNCYQQLYAPQYDTPYFLKSTNEHVPIELNQPCIKDVTSDLKKTYSLTLPFNVNSDNNLAYLAVFNKAYNGVKSVTWGAIDKENNRVTFENVLPHSLYFPIYYTAPSDYAVFGNAFYIDVDSCDAISIRNVPFTDARTDSMVTLTLNRKYPYKDTMKAVAEQMVGGQFQGANKANFSDAKLLYEITSPPPPRLICHELQDKGKYKYLRYLSPSESNKANVAIIEWITQKKYNYNNCEPISRPTVIEPNSTVVRDWNELSDNLVRFSNFAEINSSKMNYAYDGKMTKAPQIKQITCTLPQSSIITHISFAPLNADNGIVSGDYYTLYYWHNGWIEAGSELADYEYITFENVPANKLYWLVNNSQGKEECFFVMQDNKQLFIYSDLKLGQES